MFGQARGVVQAWCAKLNLAPRKPRSAVTTVCAPSLRAGVGLQLYKPDRGYRVLWLRAVDSASAAAGCDMWGARAA